MKLLEFQQHLQKEKIDVAVFIGNDPNIKYFSGFDGKYCVLEIMQNTAILYVPQMEFFRAKKSSRINVETLDDEYWQILKKKDVGMIGVNKANMSVKTFEKLKKEFPQYLIFDIGEKCIELRKTKTEEEIKIMEKGAEIADKIMKKVIDNFSKLKTETEVTSFIETEAKLLGYKMAFPTIVASGINAKIPHHVPKNEKLQKGFCIIDFGIVWNGYCTDMSRTVFIGEPNLEAKELYNKLLTLQEKCISLCLQGKPAAFVHRIAAKELGENLLHSIGHGVGVEIHEAPDLSDKSKDFIEENMVVTIEPGYYGKKHGIRIEDTIVVKKDKPIVLTKSPKELVFLT
ncbi:MAG: Xaa-Pro peptidase family protein [Candidatus Woesearchaeota archaeon]